MTQKELLYVEDAIGHEKSIVSICNEIIKCLKDAKLKAFLKKEVKKHEQMQKKLMNLLGDLANE
jgi:hypothetical protein